MKRLHLNMFQKTHLSEAGGNGLVACSELHEECNSGFPRRFFGPMEWSELLGIRSSGQGLGDVWLPWSRSQLDSPCPVIQDRSIRHTHFFFTIPSSVPQSLAALQANNGVKFFLNFEEDESAGMPHEFTFTQRRFKWYAGAPKKFASGKNLKTQIKSLSQGFMLPLVIEEVYRLHLWHLLNGNFPAVSDEIWVRCSDELQNPYFGRKHTGVVGIIDDKIYIDHLPVDEKWNELGVVPFLKPQNNSPERAVFPPLRIA